MFNDPNSDEAAEISDRHNKEVFAQDIFDLGYILLISAVGGLDLVYSEELDFTKTKDA